LSFPPEDGKVVLEPTIEVENTVFREDDDFTGGNDAVALLLSDFCPMSDPRDPLVAELKKAPPIPITIPLTRLNHLVS